MFSKAAKAKDVKTCKECSKPTVKADRDVCKHCGCSEWVVLEDDEVSAADKSALKASVINEAKAMDNMDGKDEKDDVIVVGEFDEAVTTLQTMVEQAAAAGGPEWSMAGVHLGKGCAEGKVKEDVYRSFLRWAQKPEDREKRRCNVSKAMRRLTTFAEYQHKHTERFFDTPVALDEEEIIAVSSMMSCQIPAWTSPAGSVMWVLDMSTMKPGQSEGVTDRGVMRWMWFYMLSSLFDEVVQTHGAIIVENLTGLGFSDMMKMNSKFKSVESELNKMFYGVMPFKMTSCILVGTPWWMSALIALMRLFISKKMSQRIVNTDMAGMLEAVGGCGMLPTGLGTRPYVPRYSAPAQHAPPQPVGGDQAQAEAQPSASDVNATADV